MIEWTKEELEKLTTDEVNSLRNNAAKHGKREIVDRCDAELITRKPVKPARTRDADESREGYYVSEFHFICPRELDVTKNPDGTIWTGTWVVAKTNAEAAERYSSLVALHTSKAELSYLQGTIKAWRKAPRQSKYAEDQLVKTPYGIDFLFEPKPDTIPWKGDATGEKGYAWAPIPSPIISS